MTEYQIYEIETAEKGHDKEFYIKIKVVGSKNESRFFDITQEQLNKIKEVLK